MRLLGSASFGKKCNLNTENQKEMQVFYSAAISKRVDNNTLETIDGYTVTILGCIHRSRTLSYGFPHEVCDHFLSGFPSKWKDYASQSPHEKCERSLPLSLDDLSVTRAVDILMSTARESEACAFTSIIVKDILKQCSKDSFNQSVSSETNLGHKQDGNFSKINEEINSFPVDLHKEDLGKSKETIAARVLSRAKGTRDRYPLRSKRMKKSN
ncbi:hypothetical protein L2E82_35464 [Cichorium intybus]|uniref:Uncharacterized protein n=1 Tax=Cichorium intybus TaxID=13427 RepID=A0ACB9BNV1_CICIN|nr:hypothetical protein L2E82_35464 [Cichorium intybus]